MTLLEDICLEEYSLGIEGIAVLCGVALLLLLLFIASRIIRHYCEIDEAGNYLHLGGDNCSKCKWHNTRICDDCCRCLGSISPIDFFDKKK